MNEFSLDAQTRDQYLKAMGITQWILRDEELEEVESSPTIEKLSPEQTPQVDVKESLGDGSSGSDDSPIQAHQLQPTAEITEQTQSAPATTKPQTLESPLQNADVANSVSVQEQHSSKTQLSSAGFIKMVNWPFSNEGESKLLILCRHHKDQPAQSFAAPTGPSQFMIDYLSAIKQATIKLEGGLDISMGHLTEAGIGRGHQPFSQKVEEIAPVLILLMGEEAVRHMLGENLNVAQMRMRVHRQHGVNLVVTYHPFELISQPALKKLALEDIYFIQQVLYAKP